ncbi:translation initiation factor IF-3 [Micractinium conductrix]|uniref:Translation initiation factor IF-3 n=1 Tax=Micractinium conductrix TaxID=554055 RepID=A0A2P6V570_9CHLO|nr:translation initiation factor IF-3 [Micractinium conductrix]|eukprot:PSC69241.1 translation initiation factor IF-3 [Micractinium conductrix]
MQAALAAPCHSTPQTVAWFRPGAQPPSARQLRLTVCNSYSSDQPRPTGPGWTGSATGTTPRPTGPGYQGSGYQGRGGGGSSGGYQGRGGGSPTGYQGRGGGSPGGYQGRGGGAGYQGRGGGSPGGYQGRGTGAPGGYQGRGTGAPSGYQGRGAGAPGGYQGRGAGGDEERRFGGGRGGSFGGRGRGRGMRREEPIVPMNENIRAPEVRVLAEDKTPMGVMATEDALAEARALGIDMIMVVPDAVPPVVRLMEFSKYNYELEKANKEAKKKQREAVVETKELKLRPATDVHDYQVKVKAAQKFLAKGHRVKLTLQFRGREMEFQQLGREMFQRFVEDCGNAGIDVAIEQPPMMQGRQMNMVLGLKKELVMAFRGPPPHPAPAPLQRLDLQLEGLGAFQDGAAALKAGDPLCLQQLEGNRLACATRDGTPVGLVPADKRGLLSRGPWSGTVRSVKRQLVAAAAVAAAAEAAGGAGAAAQEDQEQQQQGDAAAAPPVEEEQHEEEQQGADQPADVEEPQAPAPAQQQAGPAQHQVVQVLVRFTPEEQRWERRGQDAQPEEEEAADVARLSADQLQALADNEEVRWMLRDERLQKVVAQVDGAPDRERALLRALQAPNFKEFADKVLGVVAPEAPQ